MSRARPRFRLRPRGTLTVIAVLLLVSALVRLGDGAGRAMARADAAAATDTEASAHCETPADMQRLLDEMTAREARLADDEAALADRREALARFARRVDQARQRLAAWQGLTAAVNAGATDLALQVWRVAGPLFTDFAPAVTLAPHIDALRRGSVAARRPGQGRTAAGAKGPARRSDE